MADFKINVGQKRVIDIIKRPEVKEVLVASGSRSGKTFIIIWAIITIALKFPRSRHLIARKHFNHVKGSVWLDTLPKVLEVCYPELRGLVKWNNTDFYITLPNGAEIWMGGLDDKERVDKILGREYLTIFFNECSELTYDAYTTVKSRLAQQCSYVKPDGTLVPGKNMIFADENPTSSKHWSKVLFIDKVDPESKTAVKNPDRYAYTFIHPSENSENISADYLEMLESMPPAKRRRFLDGRFSDGSDNALWTLDVIAKSRVLEAPPLRRIVISVDPAVTATDESDETGIMVQGITAAGHLYTLADHSGIYKPNEWGELACDLYADWKADKVVGEVNQGGDMVETIIRAHSHLVNYGAVRATRNKYTRAEPVSALMYMNPSRHHIVGELPDLEMEMTEWEGKTGQASPNRIDAMVWGAFELLPDLNPQAKMQRGNFAEAMQAARGGIGYSRKTGGW